MAIELKIPSVGESITEVEIGQWLKREGDAVNKDENVVTLESEKATMELSAPVSGTLTKILKSKGEKAAVGEIIAQFEASTKAKEEAKPAKAAKSPEPTEAPKREERKKEKEEPPALAAKAETPPAVTSGREEEVVPMSLLRRTVAQRLVEAQQTMAMLTTFNEIDLTAVIALRKQHQESFTRKHGVKLGFMSFFVKAVVEALKAIPQVNASIRGNDIIYHNYFDIGMAIGSGKGLVVPVLRNAERMSFAEVEKTVAGLAARAQENKLKPDELQGGTFTITNGGVYGSLLSTPIVNPPQSAILGMHAIQERPVALDGNVVIRPMMYVALSYDHRLVDGREAVTFLARVKELIENPARILLEV
ncbi:MAG TPA: dihydrolipoyllysine-residue succinyltransferase [Candidatus Saccharimonadales bacterium]|nr:dihydrolipoyllysine-residue succinyltransferase [Candidatus Saccharimonadales bacterium]